MYLVMIALALILYRYYVSDSNRRVPHVSVLHVGVLTLLPTIRRPYSLLLPASLTASAVFSANSNPNALNTTPAHGNTATRIGQ